MTKLNIALQRMGNVPGLGRNVVTYLVVLVIGLGTAAYLFSRYDFDRPGAETYVFSADFDQAPALQLAARQEVRIAGVPVGKITDGEVTDDGRARLTMQIDPDNEVYRNARLVFRSKTPLNVMYIALDPGTPSAGKLPENGVIPVSQTQRVLQPYELLDELDARTRAALTQLVAQADVALTHADRDLPAGVLALRDAAQSYRPVVVQLRDRRDNIKRLVTAVSQIAGAAGDDDEQLNRLVVALEEALTSVDRRNRDLAATLRELPGMTHVLRRSMIDVRGLTGQLTPTLVNLDSASGRLPDVLDRLGSTVDQARAVLGDARPVIVKGRVVVNDLRPLAEDASSALGDLAPVVSTLPDATTRMVPWLDDLGAFIYNTSSSFSIGDVNGGFGRANLVVKLTQPTGGPLQ